MLAKAVRRMLSGHDVSVAADAQEALAKIKAGERYAVIISDLMMPGMSGMELHAAIAVIDPDQVTKMVFMTGGAFTPRAHEFFEQVPNPKIEKPFDRAELLSVIGTMIA